DDAATRLSAATVAELLAPLQRGAPAARRVRDGCAARLATVEDARQWLGPDLPPTAQPEDLSARAQAWADVYARWGQPADAEAARRHLRQPAPKPGGEATLPLALASAAERVGRPELAMPVYESALAYPEVAPFAANNMANLLSTGRPPLLAAVLAALASAERPEVAAFRDTASVVHAARGRTEAAIAAAAAACDRDPVNPAYRLRLARLRSSAGRYADAAATARELLAVPEPLRSFRGGRRLTKQETDWLRGTGEGLVLPTDGR
ncbi:MAG TPA: hypothetical protein VF796_25735, partial [Humisphaera sp.]